MEIKQILKKPYTEKERLDFIVEQNHNQGYEIKETESALEAWGYTEEELAKQEAERVMQYKLTKREIFLALYEDLNITPKDIQDVIINANDKEGADIGSISNYEVQKALIEFEYANEYYRGNPLVDKIGRCLGYSSEQLDYLFKYKTLKGFINLQGEVTQDA